MTAVTTRELQSEAEWREAFPVMKQLRTHLDEATYLEYLHRMTATGYRLFGLFADDRLVALAGVEMSVNMYHGRHLWVHELITDADHRSKGFGERLLSFVTEWATDNGCERVALSSGIQRTDAHRFYEQRTAMEKVSYVYLQHLDDAE